MHSVQDARSWCVRMMHWAHDPRHRPFCQTISAVSPLHSSSSAVSPLFNGISSLRRYLLSSTESPLSSAVSPLSSTVSPLSSAVSLFSRSRSSPPRLPRERGRHNPPYCTALLLDHHLPFQIFHPEAPMLSAPCPLLLPAPRLPPPSHMCRRTPRGSQIWHLRHRAQSRKLSV